MNSERHTATYLTLYAITPQKDNYPLKFPRDNRIYANTKAALSDGSIIKRFLLFVHGFFEIGVVVDGTVVNLLAAVDFDYTVTDRIHKFAVVARH